MLILKDIDLSEIRMIAPGVPEITCMCCYKRECPKSTPATAEEWRIAAKQLGWRQVEMADITYSAVCTGCIDELKQNDSEELEMCGVTA